MEKNPYEVLGVNQNASMDEIKKAYKDLARKYHPDKYANNPLSELAEEKMREINQAYDTLTKGSAGTSGTGSRSGATGSYGYGAGAGYGGAAGSRGYSNSEDAIFNQVRAYISQGNIAYADSILSQTTTRNAEWYFLKGFIYTRQGRMSEGTEYIKRAAQMDPGNAEYADAAKKVDNPYYDFRQTSVNNGYGDSSACGGPCGFCETLLCANLCCNCLGGC